MPANPNGGRGGKKKDPAVMDNFRGACPPNKLKDLDKLVKQMKGDEAKIMEKIQEWWEEGSAQVEEQWEDVNKKTVKKKLVVGGGGGGGNRGGRGGGGGRSQGSGRSGGRGREGGRGKERGGGGGGRGGDRTFRERSGKGPRNDKPGASGAPPKNVEDGSVVAATVAAPAATHSTVPNPSSAPALKGAWGARASVAAPPAPSAATTAPHKIEQPISPPAVAPETNPLDVAATVPAAGKAPLEAPEQETKSITRAPAPNGSNVWATRGSAHLIQAEKAPPAPTAAPVAQPPKGIHVDPEPLTPMVSQPDPSPTLESGLPPGVSSPGNAWGHSGPAQETVPQPIEMPPPQSPSIATNVAPPSELPTTAPVIEKAAEPVAAPPVPSPAVQKVLNMGHWERDDPSDIDFGFGFGAASSDIPSASAPATAPKESVPPAAATTVSPARPPPGLSISGMPAMPPGAVMVHELENKLESTSLNTQPNQTESASSASLPSGQHNGAPTQALPSGITQQNYNNQQQPYGMPGMYNYNAGGGSGFVGIPGPVLAGGVLPQQLGKPQGGAPQNPPQQGLYGAQPPSAGPSSGNHSNDSSNNSDNLSGTGAGPNGGVPPGMPGAIPYANPALHYGQQQFYMGQHQGGIGYNYGYGQFGGVAQGGFGYQQGLGHTQGYGGPHYDDQGHQGSSHHSGGTGGYQNKGGGAGGYRGRNNHHSNNNQYQNQYNPQQHGGYGGQPYGMGYHSHGPGGMGDPYGMQHQGGTGGGFQDDDHQKGRKGGRGNNTYQQGPPQLSGGPQSYGLQSQGGVDSAPSSGGGWSSQGGGWSGNTQSGGWQGN